MSRIPFCEFRMLTLPKRSVSVTGVDLGGALSWSQDLYTWGDKHDRPWGGSISVRARGTAMSRASSVSRETQELGANKIHTCPARSHYRSATKLAWDTKHAVIRSHALLDNAAIQNTRFSWASDAESFTFSGFETKLSYKAKKVGRWKAGNNGAHSWK